MSGEAVQRPLRLLPALAEGDPAETAAAWREAIKRAAEAIAERTWGQPHWYHGTATHALCAASGESPRAVHALLAIHDEDGAS
jgi:hypothetical protein